MVGLQFLNTMVRPNFSTSWLDPNFSTPWSELNWIFFINFWLQFFNTRRETQFLKVFCNHTMLTTPPTFSTSHGPISISQHHGRISTSQHHGWTLTSQHHGQDSTESFFKIFQISSPSLLGMTSSTLQPHFLSGVYYDNGDYPLCTSINCTKWLHTWTLKLNSSKPNQTEWWNIINKKWLK